MKSKKHIDRKSAIENVIREARKHSVDINECEQSWLRLLRELEFMCEPESRMPRFNQLLNALWIAASNDHS